MRKKKEIRTEEKPAFLKKVVKNTVEPTWKIFQKRRTFLTLGQSEAMLTSCIAMWIDTKSRLRFGGEGSKYTRNS